ncbi:Alpha/Beta hydrolase protein [Xylogone sp. PMI_703]|nr:Alpha/Beta hydrolase protein [Xylogone sp. PMI_703]
MPIHKISEDVVLNYTIHRPDASNTTSTTKLYIVLVNGMTDSSATWSLQVPAFLASGYSVLTFDNRGIGPDSSTPPGPYSAEMMASDVHSLVRGLEIPRPFHLLGVSMGGMIAQAYALKWPEDLISVVFGCTYAKPGPFNSRLFDGWGRVARTMGIDEVIREVMLWCFTPRFYDKGKESAEFVEEGVQDVTSRMNVEGYLAQLEAVRRFDSSSHISSLGSNDGDKRALGSRICVLAGREDILIPVGKSRELHELIPGSKWVTVSGGHGCMWEFADEFNDAIIKFLKGTEEEK